MISSVGSALPEPIFIEDGVKLSSAQQTKPSRTNLQTIAPICSAQMGAISVVREVMDWQEEICEDWMNKPGNFPGLCSAILRLHGA
jgi:hypothetical protein